MAGMIKNIFGLNTQDVAEQRAELNRLKSAQRIKQGDIDPTVAILGQQFGDMLGRGLMKKLGYEDTEMAQAQAQEEDAAELNRKVTDGELEFGSKEYNLTLAGLYTKYGEPEKAAQYFSKVQNEERYEFERNGRIGNVARAIVNDSDGTITQEKFMSQLKAAYPNQDLSRYDNFITDDDLFDSAGGDNKEIPIGTVDKSTGQTLYKVKGGWSDEPPTGVQKENKNLGLQKQFDFLNKTPNNSEAAKESFQKFLDSQNKLKGL